MPYTTLNKIREFSPCEGVWKQEAAKWQHLSNLKISICTGSTKERQEALSQDADIYVINRQGQTKPVRIIHLAIDGTIDQKVLSALDKKANTQDELISYFKYFK